MAAGSRADGGSSPTPYARSPAGGFDPARDVEPSSAGAAWAGLFERYGPLALRLARGLLAHASEAEDVVQEAVRGLLERVRAGEARFESEEHARNYFLRAVHNRAVDLRREGERRRPAALEAAPMDGLAAVPDPTLALDEREERVRAGERLQQALAALGERERALVELRYVEGLAYREIAARTGAPISTLHSRVEAALARIRRHLGKEGHRP